MEKLYCEWSFTDFVRLTLISLNSLFSKSAFSMNWGYECAPARKTSNNGFFLGIL